MWIKRERHRFVYKRTLNCSGVGRDSLVIGPLERAKVLQLVIKKDVALVFSLKTAEVQIHLPRQKAALFCRIFRKKTEIAIQTRSAFALFPPFKNLNLEKKTFLKVAKSRVDAATLNLLDLVIRNCCSCSFKPVN